MKIVDMGRTKPKGKDKDGINAPGAWSGEEEGPRVHLDHDRMKKVGMAKPPATGDEYHIQGHARVVGSREEPAPDGKGEPIHSVEIVIHHMGAEPKGRDGEPEQDYDEDGYGKPNRAKSVRKDLEKAAESVEKRHAVTARTGKKIAEKPEPNAKQGY